MPGRAVAKYVVDRAARTVTVDDATTYEIRAAGEHIYEVLLGPRVIGRFEVEARDDGTWDAFVSAEEGEDSDRVRSVVRAARRNGLAR